MVSDQQMTEHRQRAAREVAAAAEARRVAEVAAQARQDALADAGTNQDPLPEGPDVPPDGTL